MHPGVDSYTTGYYPHYFDFLALAAAMAGRGAQTIGTTDRRATAIPTDLLAAPGMSFLRHQLTRRLQSRGGAAITRRRYGNCAPRTLWKNADAARAMADFRRAWAAADLQIESSAY